MTENARTEYSRDEVATKIVDVTTACADGYRRNISQFNTAAENEAAEKCAIAASNTGYFLLRTFGYSSDEIKTLCDHSVSGSRLPSAHLG